MNPTSYGKVTSVEWIGGWDIAPAGCGVKGTATDNDAKVHITREDLPDLIITVGIGGCVTHVGTIALVVGGP